MDNLGLSDDSDVLRLLKGNTEDAFLPPVFRQRVLEASRRLVLGRPRLQLRRRRLVFALGIAGALLAAFAAWGPRQPTRAGLRSAALMGARWAKPFVTVAAVQPPATGRYGIGLVVGDRLPAGAPVLTGKEGRVTLLTRRGSEFTLNENTRLSLGGDRASGALRRGEIYCRSRLHEIKRIATAAGDIHLLGTALDAAVRNADTVTVTVVQGKVRLANRHGEATVEAGRQAVLTVAQAPAGGVPVSTSAATAWYDGRNRIMSDFGRIAFMVQRKSEYLFANEVWTMRADGTDKRLVKAYLGCTAYLGPWLPDSQWLFVQTYGAKTGDMDFQHRRIRGEGSSPILWGMMQGWLLDTATGNEVPVSLPADYDPSRMSISPDGSKVVFNGRRSEPWRFEKPEMGPWVLDLNTGNIRKLEQAAVSSSSSYSWSPDGSVLATSYTDKTQDVATARLRLVDSRTGEAEELGIQGYSPVFSPDGTRLAYCADHAWTPSGQYQNRVYVLDLRTMRTAPVIPLTTRAQSLSWSPDGDYIAYIENYETYTDPDDGVVIPDYVLCLAAADGSGVRRLYRADERLQALAWTPDGSAVHVSTSKGVHLIRADGSPVVDLGGTEEDCVLTPAQEADMTAALADLYEAVFQFAMGQREEGRLGNYGETGTPTPLAIHSRNSASTICFCTRTPRRRRPTAPMPR
jgi:Tol biopolymer transport system component